MMRGDVCETNTEKLSDDSPGQETSMATKSCKNPNHSTLIFNPWWPNLHYYGIGFKKLSELYPQTKLNTIITNSVNIWYNDIVRM